MQEDVIRILYVDDSKFDRTLVRHALEEEHGGFQITEATSGRDVARHLRSATFDLVLTDFNIPGSSGFEVLQTVRSCSPGLPVVVITGAGSEHVAVEAMKRGASDYIIKNDEQLEKLPQTLLRVIQHKKRQRDWRQSHHRLQRQMQQQSAVAALGQRALAGTDLTMLLNQAVRLLADALQVEYCNVFECLAGYQTLCLRASSGWQGRLTVDAGVNSEAAFLLQARTPVVINDFRLEKPFTGAPLICEQQVASSMGMAIYKSDKPWGLLTVHTAHLRTFTPEDVQFMQSVVQVLVSAIARVQTEHELANAQRKVTELGQLKSAFLNNISHEIRTPLTSIIGFAAVLDHEVQPEHQEMVQFIEQSGHRLLNTFNQILDLAMLEAGSLNLEPEPIDLRGVVEDKVLTVWSKSETEGVALQLDLPTDPVMVPLDRRCLDRVLGHLVSNAIKFTDDGTVTVNMERTGGGVVIQVKDTGVGIGPEFLPHLFDTFKQESKGLTRQYQGTGLGLSLTRQFVTLMGGTISVESHKGQGSIFTLGIPVPAVMLESTPARPSASEERSMAAQPPARPNVAPRPKNLAS